MALSASSTAFWNRIVRLRLRQRHTTRRKFERLRDEHGYAGGITIVGDYVGEQRLRGREMFVPLAHPAGHAQVDFGEAVGVIGGVERKLHYFVMELPHSDGCFVKAYPAETTAAFCDGHVSAFAFFGGMPLSVLYDNTKIAVARILGDGKRTHVFAELQSHYLFEDHFGRPGKGNDKDKVEGLVGYSRRNFMVALPAFASFRELNVYLEDRCRARMKDRLRGHDGTIGEKLARDVAAFHPLPAHAYDSCDRKTARVSSLSLVRYKGNDYSVPVTFDHHEVLVRGYVDEVIISYGATEIARHVRSWEKEDFVFDSLHCLRLLEQKTNALDQAAPLQGWDLPECFATIRRLLEARIGKLGKWEFVQVLRLLEAFRMDQVAAGVAAALERGTIGFDAVQASGAVPCRAQTAPARHDGLSLSAQGLRGGDIADELPEPSVGRPVMSDTPQILLAHHLKVLKLPTFLREYDKLARQCAAEGVDHSRYLLRLSELELIDRHRRTVERKIKAAGFPAVKSLDSFDFLAIPSLNKMPVLDLSRCEYISRNENIIAVGNSGTRKTHIALALGLEACRRGKSVGFSAVMKADLSDYGAVWLDFGPAVALGFVHFVVALPGEGDVIAVARCEYLPGDAAEGD